MNVVNLPSVNPLEFWLSRTGTGEVVRFSRCAEGADERERLGAGVVATNFDI